MGALRAIQELTLTCPGDISLVGFGDHIWARLFTPPLTVIRQPIAQISNAAVDLLLKAITHKKQRRREEEPPSEIALPDMVLEAELVRRASCRRVTSVVEV
jgi:DNA-binding LacI/PurR family transcriptional regulator